MLYLKKIELLFFKLPFSYSVIKMSSTSNRNVVIATYAPPKATFILPEGIHLEDKTMIKSYSIKNYVLRIKLNDGKILKIRPYQDIEDPDFTYPEEIDFSTAEDEDIDIDDYDDSEFVTEKTKKS